MSEGWTEERVETLKRLWAEGYSCSQVAVQLGGGLTRNAVIGKVSRLKLAKRRNPSLAIPRRERQPRVARPPRSERLPPSRRAAVRTPEGRGPEQSLIERLSRSKVWDVLPETSPMALEHTTGCRWPIGDNLPFTFCNAPFPAPVGPRDQHYCEIHRRASHGFFTGAPDA